MFINDKEKMRDFEELSEDQTYINTNKDYDLAELFDCSIDIIDNMPMRFLIGFRDLI